MTSITPAAREHFRAFFDHNRARFVAALALTVLDIPSALIGSWLLGEIIDVIAAGDLGRLQALLALCAVFMVASFAISVGMYRAKSDFVFRALVSYKSLAFRRLSEKSIRAFSRENTGSYLSLLTNDVASVEEGYLKRSFLLVYHALLFVGTLAMMLFYSVPLTLAAVALSLLPLAASVLMGRELAVRERAVSDRNEAFVSELRDLLAGFSVIKSFKAEAQARGLFDAASGAAEEAKRARYWWDCLITAVSGDLCSVLLQFGVFFIGAWLAIDGQITAGTVLIFVNLCNYLMQPISIVPQYWASRRAAAGLVEKLAAATRENAERAGERIDPRLERGIEVSGVSFGYEPGAPVLRDVSLELAAGRSYAVVGASGSGKSTLLNLLMGGYDGYEGSITLDGHELRDVEAGSLYDLVSLIDQSVFLFDDTIRANVTMFRDFPDEAVDDAVRRAGLAALVAEKGEGFRCGENGSALSGGERQRVSIARALLRRTPVLLVDEATAALDNQTARAVGEEILGLEGLTRVVVTHRLEAPLLERYDEVVALRDGRVVERGTFDELMAARGYFYSLFTVSN